MNKANQMREEHALQDALKQIAYHKQIHTANEKIIDNLHESNKIQEGTIALQKETIEVQSRHLDSLTEDLEQIRAEVLELTTPRKDWWRRIFN